MLSPKKLNRNSPTKENNSPTRKITDKKQQKAVPPEVLLSAIHQLQSLIIKLGGKVPNHLTFGLTHSKGELIRPQPAINSLNVKDLQQEIRQLKIKLNNYEFELKRNVEDSAQFRLKSKLERDRQTKKLKSEIARLQLQLREDNHKWENKIQQMRERFQQKYNEQVQTIRDQCDKMLKEANQKAQKQVSEIQQKCQQSIKQIESSKVIEINEIKVETEVKLQIKQKQYQEQKQRIRMKHVESIKKLERKQEQMLTVFDSEKKVEQKKQDEEKVVFNKTKEKLYNDLYIVRKEKEELNKTILELKAEILRLEKNISEKEKEKDRMQRQYQQQIRRIQDRNVCQIEETHGLHAAQISQLIKNHDIELKQFQQMIEVMNKAKQERQALLKESQQEIYKKFEERPSKTQDTENIQKLNQQLLIKEEQLNSAKDQLRKAKLERQNNEKNYTRIFSARCPREKTQEKEKKQVSSKQKDRQRIYRTAHTVDINYILKVCNKNF